MIKALELVFLLFLLIGCSPYDENEVVSITSYYASVDLSYDDIWNPSNIDIQRLKEDLYLHVERLRTETQSEWRLKHLRYISEHLEDYGLEYAGLIVSGKHLIACQMHFIEGIESRVVNGSFSLILDGGSSVLHLVYDPENRKFESFHWNGEA